MAIENRTTAEVQLLKKVLWNTTKAVENYDSDSRNPAMLTAVNAAITALKTQVDATAADVTTAAPEFPRPAT